MVGDVGVVEGEDFVFGIVDDTARDARPFESSAFVVSLAGDFDLCLCGSGEIPSGSEEEGEEEKNSVLFHGVVGSREVLLSRCQSREPPTQKIVTFNFEDLLIYKMCI